MMNERIALGFGDNIDYEIVWDSEGFAELIVRYEINDPELPVDASVNRNVIWSYRYWAL